MVGGKGFWRPLTEGVAVRKNSGANVGTRPRLNLIEGSGVTLTVADDGTDDEVDVTIAAAGGGAGAMTVLGEVELAAAAATISFSSISQVYKDMVIVGRLRTDQAAVLTVPEIQVGATSVDTGNNYNAQYTSIDQGAGVTSNDIASTNGWHLLAMGASAGAGMFGSFHMEITRYTKAAERGHMHGYGSVISGTTMRQFTFGGIWENTTDAIDIITFNPVGGSNFAAGSVVTLYGRG